MDAHRFEYLLRSLSASPSRRSAVRLLAGLVLGSPLARGAAETAAHNALKKCKKRDGDRKKVCRKKAKKHNAQHRQQNAPPPVPVLIYQCPGPQETPGSGGGKTRIAQTFTAAQSGSLQKIAVGITKEEGSEGDYVVELLAVGADGKPTNTELASVVIPNDAVPDGPSTLTANFSGPLLVAGTAYAAALSRPREELFDRFDFDVRAGDDCSGSLFAQAPADSGQFEIVPPGDLDLVVSVTVLA
jgi:hypothetical protein